MRRWREQGQQRVEEEPEINMVAIYAVEKTTTHVDHISGQGLGTGEPIEVSPQTETIYVWDGNFQLTEDEKRRGLTGDYSSGETGLEALAINLADSYLLRQIPELTSKGAATFTLSFEVSEGAISSHRWQNDKKLRNLTPDEQRIFSDVFAAATEQFEETRLPSDAELVRIWDGAYRRMESVVPPNEKDVVYILCGSIDDPDKLEKVLDKFRNYLTYESIYFINLTIAKKRDYKEKTT